MLTHVCDLVPGAFTHTIGDAHVYVDHVDALKLQLHSQFPTLEIRREKDGIIGGWKAEDSVVKGYDPIKALR
jgi:thymidylate synthase